jgi:hypothetical protein
MWHKARSQPSQSGLAGPTSLAGQPGIGATAISALPTCQGGSVHGVSYSAPKFILYRVGRERWGSEGRRTSRLVRSHMSNSSMKALPESVWIRWSFPSSSSVDCGSSAGILWIPTENWLSSPSCVVESQLVRIILRHYLEVGDLPIIVSHSFTALMLFVHLHTV